MRVMKHFLLWQLGLAEAWTSRTAAECACLERHAAGRRRLVEIGCWYGVNTLRLRRAMAPEGVLYAVDPYAPGRLGFSAVRHVARREVARCRNGSVRWLRMTDGEAARWLAGAGEGPVDFLFTDAVNTYEGLRVTWEGWGPLVAPSGVVVLGDSRPSEARPEELGSAVFTREVILRDPRFGAVEAVDTLTVLRRESL